MIGLDAYVRPWDDRDRVRLERMFTRLSRQTVIQRFFTLTQTLNEPFLRGLADVDHDHHEALVVPIGDEIIALASYHLDQTDPTRADIAVLIEDAWQQHGLGRLLVGRLSRLAAERGVAVFHADVLFQNTAARGLIRRMDRQARATVDGTSLSYELPLRAA
jgi:GNAT superfamily N-acetyltransferase